MMLSVSLCVWLSVCACEGKLVKLYTLVSHGVLMVPLRRHLVFPIMTKSPVVTLYMVSSYY